MAQELSFDQMRGGAGGSSPEGGLSFADLQPPAQEESAPTEINQKTVGSSAALAAAETMAEFGKQHAFDVASIAASKPEPHGFMANLKSPMQNLREDNIWKEIGDIQADMKDAHDYLHLPTKQGSLYEQELERRKKLNPKNSFDNPYLPHWDNMAMARWEHEQSHKLVTQWHDKGKPHDLTLHQMWTAVASDPGRFAAEALNSMMSHPELLLFPVGESGNIERGTAAALMKLARVSPRVAKVIGHATAAGVAGAVISAPSSIIEQTATKGDVNPKAFIRDIGVGAFTTAVMAGGIKLAAGVHAKVTGGSARRIASEIDEKVSAEVAKGRDPAEALDDVLKQMKVVGGKDITKAVKDQIEGAKAREAAAEEAGKKDESALKSHAKHAAKHEVQDTEKKALDAEPEKPTELHEAPKEHFVKAKAHEMAQKPIEETEQKMIDEGGEKADTPTPVLSPRLEQTVSEPKKPLPWEYDPHNIPSLEQRHEMLKSAPTNAERQQLIQRFQKEDALRAQAARGEAQQEAATKEIQRGEAAKDQTQEQGTPLTQDQVHKIPPEVETELPQELKDFKPQTAQSGEIDRRLLAVLGLSSASAVAAYALTDDPKTAMAAALAVGGIAAGAVVAKRFGDAASKMYATHLLDTRYMPNDLLRGYYGDVRSTELAIRRQSNALETMVPGEINREPVTHYLQGEPVDPKGQPVKLTPEQKALADAVRKAFDDIGKVAQKEGVIEDLRQNYVTGLWRRGVRSGDNLFRQIMAASASHYSPGMSPRSRFGLEKSIPSYVQGIKQGFVPVTMDPVKILQKYAFNVTKAIANKKLIESLKTDTMPDGRRLIMSRVEAARLRQAAEDARELSRRFFGTDQEQQYTEAAMVATARARALEDYEFVKGNRQLADYLVHKDLVSPIRFVFDSGSDMEAIRAMHALSMIQKQGIFSFSMFHAKSLMDAAVGASYVAGPAGIAAGAATYAATGGNPEATAAAAGLTAMFIAGRAARAGFKMFRDGKAGDVVDLLVRNSLILEKPIDTDQALLSTVLKQVSAEAEKHLFLGGKVGARSVDAARKIAEAHNYFLWDVLQPGLKVSLASSYYNKLLMKNLAEHAKDPRVPLRDINEMARQASTFTNDIFGGLDWFELANGVKTRGLRWLAFGLSRRSGRELQQILMLAPDWTVATARTWLKALPGMSPPEVRARYQQYLVTSAMMYSIVADGLNMHFTGHHFWQNEDPTTVELGNGVRMNLSKHFMEGMHWLTKPDQQALNKLGGVPKEAAEQLLNKEYLSVHGSPPLTATVDERIKAFEKTTGRKPGVADIAKMVAKTAGNRIGHAAIFPAPITGRVLIQQGAAAAASGYAGFPIYGKTEQQYVDEAIQRASDRGQDIEKAARLARKRWDRRMRTQRDVENQP